MHAGKDDEYSVKMQLKQIASKLAESQPSTTLRTNEPMTLADAGFSLARRALMAAKQLQVSEKKSKWKYLGDQGGFIFFHDNAHLKKK